MLLDFTYAYKLDGDKLFCSAPSTNTPSGRCEGVIDYDPGFNFLYCTKCGVKYKAQELAKAIESNNVIVKAEGEQKMKISIKGGTKNLEKRQIVTGEYADLVTATPTKPIVKAKTKGGSKDVKKTSTDNKDTVVKEEKPKKETAKKDTKKVAKEDKKKEVVCPVEFDETLIKKDETPVVKEVVKDPTDGMSAIEAFNYHMNAAKESLKAMNKQEIREALTNIDFVEIIEKYCDFVIVPTENPVYYNDEYKSFVIKCNYKIVLREENDDEEIIIYEQEGDDPVEIHINIDYAYECLENAGCVFSNSFGTNEFEKVEEFSAKVINIKDIFPDKKSKKILAIIDGNNDYLAVGDRLIAVDIIDDQSVDKVSIVSKKWLDDIMSDTETPDPVKEETVESDTEIKSEIPVGVLAPNVAVNGVPTEEVEETSEEE